MVLNFPTSLVTGLPRQFDARSLIPILRNYFWKIETGVVRTVTWLEDGRSITLGIWGPGDFIGGQILNSHYQIECLTQVEAASCRSSDWEQTKMILLSHIHQFEQLTVVRSHKKADTMLLKLLAWLSQRFGREAEQGQLIDLRLTHQDIADMLGITRVTITRLLNQLEEQGQIARLPLHRIVLKEAELWHYEI
jgi:CRP-like cAMP-binding protein